MWLAEASASLSPLRCLLLVSLTVFYGCPLRDSSSPLAGASAPDSTSAVSELKPDCPITQQLSHETPHTYRIYLLSGQYVSILITKGAANLQLTVVELGGHPLRDIVSWRDGPLRISFITAVEGIHLLEVRSLESDVSSHEYVLNVEDVRTPTERDRKDDAALRAYAEAEKLRAEWSGNSSRAAVERYAEASATWQANARPRQAAGALLDAGDTLFTLSEYSRALDFYHRALKLSRGAGDERGVVQAMDSIGYVRANTDDAQRALSYFRHVLNFYLKVRPVDRSVEDIRGTARVNNNLGEAYYYRGDLQKAKKYFNHALEMHAQAGDRRGQALAHLNLGYTYSDSGDIYNSLAHLQLALTLWRAVNDKRGEALSYTGQGIVFSLQGEKQKAFDAYKRALQLFHSIGDKQGEAAALNSMGKAYEDLNEPQIALDHYNLALKLFQASGNIDAEAVTKYYVGRVYRSLNDDERALYFYKQCLVLSRALGKRRIENYALTDIASIQALSGRNRLALDGYGKVLRFYRGQKDKRGQAHVLSSMGDVYFSLADKPKALDFFRQALTLSRNAGDQKGEASTLYKISRVERDGGDLEQALTDIKAALQISESLRIRVASRDLRSSYFASVNDQYVLFIDLLMRMHERHPSEGFAAAALQASESSRARTLLETLADAHLEVRQDVDPELLEREHSLQQSLAAKAESQVLLRVAGDHRDEAGGLEEEIRKLTTEYNEVVAEVREQGLRSATLVPPRPLRVEEIQAELLDDNTALLEYALGDEKSYLWVVTATSVSSYELPSRAEIEDVARELYRLLTASQAEGKVALAGASLADSLDEQYWQTASVMSQMLLGRAAPQLGRKRLLIVADGALQYIPFEALPVPAVSPTDAAWSINVGGSGDGDTLVPLVWEHEIVNLPSATTLALLRRRGPRQATAPGKLVMVLADPVFEPDDPRLRRSDLASHAAQAEQVEAVQLRAALRSVGGMSGDLTLTRLPFTLQEGKAIMEITPEGEGRLVTSFAASRALAIEGGLSDYRIVHFATHGVINCQHPELSGIVLSMLNERGERENGFLQLHDIYALDLSADLVVLSACSTGLGKDIRGEGLVGLTQGFLHVGARSVVASLWRVDDRATAELMRHFYQGMFKERLPPAAALRYAKKALWQEKRWRSPHYWAAFVLQGEYRQSISAEAETSSGAPATFAIMTLILLLVIGVLLETAKKRRINAS
jgi:CHAT domain-containing protein/predicted negative regulator of RcsB-dependent stress response